MPQKGWSTMFNFVIAVALVAAILGSFFSFCEWADESRRVPFFVKWYSDWNRREGKRRIEKTKAQS